MADTQRPWARHYFEEWQRRAGDPRLPYWLRVAAIAYGSHLDNGHAEFKRGELALILGEPGKPYPNVRRAIEDAVGFGWLGEGSFYRCLIVPADLARKGDLWAKRKPCRTHQAQARKDAKTTPGERFKAPLSTPDERFDPRKPRQVSGSEPEPLFSDLVPASTHQPQAGLHLVTDGRGPDMPRRNANSRRHPPRRHLEVEPDDGPPNYDAIARQLVLAGKAPHTILGSIPSRYLPRYATNPTTQETRP